MPWCLQGRHASPPGKCWACAARRKAKTSTLDARSPMKSLADLAASRRTGSPGRHHRRAHCYRCLVAGGAGAKRGAAGCSPSSCRRIASAALAEFQSAKQTVPGSQPIEKLDRRAYRNCPVQPGGMNHGGSQLGRPSFLVLGRDAPLSIRSVSGASDRCYTSAQYQCCGCSHH